jgi:hypothetical protein
VIPDLQRLISAIIRKIKLKKTQQSNQDTRTADEYVGVRHGNVPLEVQERKAEEDQLQYQGLQSGLHVVFVRNIIRQLKGETWSMRDLPK